MDCLLLLRCDEIARRKTMPFSRRVRRRVRQQVIVKASASPGTITNPAVAGSLVDRLIKTSHPPYERAQLRPDKGLAGAPVSIKQATGVRQASSAELN